MLARVVFAGLAAVGLLVLLVLFTPLVPWWARMLAGPWNDPTGDTLIVLGGSEGPDDVIIGESSYWRSTYAIRAYRQEPFRTILISGGGGSAVTIAESMAEFFACHGIPPQAIVMEKRSTSTRENAVYAADILAHLSGRNVLMTSDFHMFRAYRAFRKLGIEVLPRPIPDAIKRGGTFKNRFGAFVDLCRETAAIGYYYVRGWI